MEETLRESVNVLVSRGGGQESSTGQPRRWRLGDTIEDTRRESVTGWPVRRGGGGGIAK